MSVHDRVRARVLLAASAVVVSLLMEPVVVPTSAAADSSTESQFIADTNSARSQNGLRSYAVASDLTSLARRWAAHMAANRTLEHNPSLTSDVCCWSDLGENVGEGEYVSQIQRAFMSSSEHRANILSATFTQVGIGTARSSDGRLYVDEVFRRESGQAPSGYVHRTAVRSYVARASRSASRAPRQAPRRASASRVALPTAAMIATRIVRWRQQVARLSHADAVATAFAYLRGLASVTR